MGGYQNDPGTVQQEAGFGFQDRFWSESSVDGLTAKASGTQANSTKLTSMVNRVTTVASVADGVLLPPASILGLSIGVINGAANLMQVFAQGTDTINAVAGATGVPQMANSAVYYLCVASGVWIAQGIGSGYAGALPTFSSVDNLTAVGTNQGNAAAAQVASVVRYTTVAAGTGALLPSAKVGSEVTICNAGANALLMYATPSTDVINATSNATGFSIATGKSATFYATSNGQWHTLLSA